MNEQHYLYIAWLAFTACFFVYVKFFRVKNFFIALLIALPLTFVNILVVAWVAAAVNGVFHIRQSYSGGDNNFVYDYFIIMPILIAIVIRWGRR